MDIPIEIIKITEFFLSNKYFSTKIENSISIILPVCAYIPLGSCVSSTLFNIYTNKMLSLANANISLFADDIMFYCAKKILRIVIIQLQCQIQIAIEWFIKWHIRINEAKTTAILFGLINSPNLSNIKINNINIA